ncbi:MAG: aminomethyl-transferring glycine dehydrogenase subunit GcvPA [bacterium]|nr:aminomethyl-transferring glycine dehydrogenase subunit GcvPA [bacterium]
MTYTPHTRHDLSVMFTAIGIERIEELFSDIPENLLIQGELELPSSFSEIEVRKIFQEMANKNAVDNKAICFAGMGSYEHFIASAVNPLLFRSEFYTAYTPYQPEVAQGTLQCIYEFQSLVTRLTGLPVANASLYDGATAIAEAIQLLRSFTKKDRIVITRGVNPLYRQVVETIIGCTEPEIIYCPVKNGITDLVELEMLLTPETACVVLQQPNFLGQIEDLEKSIQLIKSKNIPVIVSSYPVSLGMLEAPGNLGADIVVGDGQCLGPGLLNGGPYLGLFAAKKEYVRLMPGRIAARTEDSQGRKGYVLTLQTREQHIRREKATSNICTNQGLMMLAMLFNVSFIGKKGLQEMAFQSHQKALYLSSMLKDVGLPPVYTGPFFNEFVVHPKCGAEEFIVKMLEKEILAGVDLGKFDADYQGKVLITVTEMRDKKQLDDYVVFADKVNQG